MLKLSAALVCLFLGIAAGFFVQKHMYGVFDGVVIWVSAAVVSLFVFIIFYYPLFRPIADIISDRLSVAVHRGQHIRAGSGVDDLSERPSSIRCTICGDDFGPVCPKCLTDMSRSTRH